MRRKCKHCGKALGEVTAHVLYHPKCQKQASSLRNQLRKKLAKQPLDPLNCVVCGDKFTPTCHRNTHCPPCAENRREKNYQQRANKEEAKSWESLAEVNALKRTNIHYLVREPTERFLRQVTEILNGERIYVNGACIEQEKVKAE